MTCKEYKELVIDLFKRGNATDQQYEEMATAVLYASEESSESVQSIDDAVLPEHE